mmetsp:Transcript_2274/g.3627  ORF Transcript_2274/g.3627 Transcript_2274/m.3627 type:complete len:402 (-) Transcript_2274:1254-2459(-)
MTNMMRASGILLLAHLAQQSGVCAFAPFAMSSSSSSKRKVKTNQGKAAGGFGKKEDAVPVSHSRDESQTTQNLINFLLQWKSKGLGVDAEAGTEIGYDENGFRGLYAMKAFKKGDIICKIPSDCALALADPSVAATEEVSEVDGAVNYLQWYAMNPQARQMWSPYIDTLPTREANFDPTPDFYTDEEIAQLEFPMIVKKALERKEQIAELAQKTNLPFDEVQFATWLVSSRSFSIKITIDDGDLVRETSEADADGLKGNSETYKMREQGLRVLLPYLDMINHESDNYNSELHLIDPEKDDAWFAIRAARPIKKNKEITISYGAAGVETSVGLLMNYGFIQDENKFDALLLKKGGDDCIDSVEGWSTTLEDDEQQLAAGVSGNMANVLRFRAKMKRSYPPTE